MQIELNVISLVHGLSLILWKDKKIIEQFQLRNA